MQLNSLFQDGAVFQRDIFVPVWGRTKESTYVDAEINGVKSCCLAARTGDFILRLPPMKAGGPYTLTITNRETGDKAVVNDIMIGEVWIASGQSNMEYQLNSRWAPVAFPSGISCEDVADAQFNEFKQSAVDGDQFRFFVVEQDASCEPQYSAKGCWKHFTADTCGDSSAVAAWFGRKIREKLNIPVGIICTSWGGTIATAWTSRNGLLNNPVTATMMTALDMNLTDAECWRLAEAGGIDYSKITLPDPGNKGFDLGYARPNFKDDKWTSMDIPGSWIRQDICGNGVVWVRKSVAIPDKWIGKELALHTGGIDKQDTSYFNGVEIGRTGKDFETDYWGTPRCYDIPASLVTSNRCTVAIRGYSFIYEGCFWGVEDDYYLEEKSSGERVPLAGKWLALAEVDFGIKTNAKACLPGNPNTPAILFNGMINPLVPYGIRGAIWYQGESDAQSIASSHEYNAKLRTMISDWRYHWGQGDFPFIQTILANFYERADYSRYSTWAVLRDEQRKLCDEMTNVYNGSAIDIGEEKDIHPQNKKDVGFRLAYTALHNVYCCSDVVPEGPRFRRAVREGHSIRLFFDYADGLCIKGDARKSFYLSEDGIGYNEADSVAIEGNSVLVSCEKVAFPNNVRYAWSDNPYSTLYNAAGLPAAPFQWN